MKDNAVKVLSLLLSGKKLWINEKQYCACEFGNGVKILTVEHYTIVNSLTKEREVMSIYKENDISLHDFIEMCNKIHPILLQNIIDEGK